MGRGILGEAVSGSSDLSASYSHSLPFLRSCCLPGGGARGEVGVPSAPITPGKVSLGTEENPSLFRFL